jgi:NAD(P)-dependent dehydrogenase (short-subunit alcohol dehydrogenase family)
VQGGSTSIMTTAPPPQFPLHKIPRTWLISSATSPFGLALARKLLAHGDNVLLGVISIDTSGDFPEYTGSNAAFRRFLNEEAIEEGWESQMRVVNCDGRSASKNQVFVGSRVI